MSILTIIPARSGSKRLPGKNWEKVGGKTLLQRALDCADTREDIAIVTDAVDRVPREERGAELYVLHEPEQLAGDSIEMGEVVRWACAEYEDANYHSRPDVVLLLQPTSPLRDVLDVDRCRGIFERSGCDSVVSVTYDLATKGYRRNGAIYLTRWDLAARGELMGGWTQFYVMPPERSIDINTAEDLAEARRLAGDG